MRDLSTVPYIIFSVRRIAALESSGPRGRAWCRMLAASESVVASSAVASSVVAPSAVVTSSGAGRERLEHRRRTAFAHCSSASPTLVSFHHFCSPSPGQANEKENGHGQTQSAVVWGANCVCARAVWGDNCSFGVVVSSAVEFSCRQKENGVGHENLGKMGTSPAVYLLGT